MIHLVWFMLGAFCGAVSVGLGILYALGGGFERDHRRNFGTKR